MQAQRNHAPHIADPWTAHRAVLDLLIEHHPAAWSTAELARELAPRAEVTSGKEPSTATVEDALAHLYGAGLVHRVGQFAFASRAAVESARLGG
jgi:Fe2+ or Zn2+ uptake regulation protein